jgi:hypothetical protein
MIRRRDPLMKPPFGAQLDLDHPHSVGLVACFRLAEDWTGGDDGGGFFKGVVLDESEFRNHATLSNTAAPNNEGGPYGPVRGWIRAGGGQMISVPNRVEYEIDGVARTTFSMEALVASNGVDPAAGVSIAFCYGDAGLDSGVTNQGYGIGVVPSLGRMFARVGTTGVNATNGAVTCNDRTWSHIAATYDGANIRRYVNGKLIGTTAKVGYTSLTGQNLGIGNTPSGSDSQRTFRGRIAHVRLWVNRVLDIQTLKELSLSPYAAWIGSMAERHAWYFMQGSPIVVQSQTIQMRGNIRAVESQSLTLRGNIIGTQVQTIQMRARILVPPPTIQMQAYIAEPETVPDTLIESWEVTDTFGEFSRQFSLSATEVGTFQVGNDVRITAGYDENRLTMIEGTIDQTASQLSTDNQTVQVSGRDAGAREVLSIHITKTWNLEATILPLRAKTIIEEAAGLAGLDIGVLDFPDYELFQTYAAIGRTVLEIVAELIEPFNQFARVQHVTEIRGRQLSVRRLDFTDVPASGYQLTREEHASQTRTQRLYLEQPRLNEVTGFVIRGASWTTPRGDLGETVKIEYLREETTDEVSGSISGVVQKPGDATVATTNANIVRVVVTETTVITRLYGDKALSRIEEVVLNSVLSLRTTERYWYFEPDPRVQVIAADINTLINQSSTPSSNALLWQTHTYREAWIDVAGVTLFGEKEKTVTKNYYNADHEICSQTDTKQELDEATGQWQITDHVTRNHSQVTGGLVRTTLQNFIFEGNRFKLTSADVQHVGGTRPRPNNPAGKQNVITHQAQSPAGDLDIDGNVIDYGEGLYLWTFDNPYIGQDVCDALYTETQIEQDFQVAGYRWEECQFQGILNPNLRAGQPVSIEVSEGVFVNYWLVEVTTRFTWNLATSSGTARRLTLDDLTDPSFSGVGCDG